MPPARTAAEGEPGIVRPLAPGEDAWNEGEVEGAAKRIDELGRPGENDAVIPGSASQRNELSERKPAEPNVRLPLPPTLAGAPSARKEGTALAPEVAEDDNVDAGGAAEDATAVAAEAPEPPPLAPPPKEAMAGSVEPTT